MILHLSIFIGILFPFTQRSIYWNGSFNQECSVDWSWKHAHIFVFPFNSELYFRFSMFCYKRCSLNHWLCLDLIKMILSQETWKEPMDSSLKWRNSVCGAYHFLRFITDFLEPLSIVNDKFLYNYGHFCKGTKKA